MTKATNTLTKSSRSEIQKAKGRPMLSWVGKKPLDKVEYFPAQEKEVYGDKKSKNFNKLFWGDNLQVLSHLLKEYRGEIDLIYIDPPFDSKADYVKKVKIRGQKIEGQQQNLLEEKQYTDIWENDEYLQFMYERLLIMRELLVNRGIFVLHCDYHKNYLLRCLLDEIFGPESLISEVIWKRQAAHSDAKNIGNLHDTIFFYGNGPNSLLKKTHIPYSEEYLKTHYQKVDKDGRKFEDQSCVPPRDQGPIYEWKGIKRAWRYTKDKMEDFEKKGHLYYTSTGMPRLKKYLDEMPGLPLQSVWTDISPINSQAIESTGYPTQKREALLERIINMGSESGDLVMDCFCGSGTTLAVAQKLGRKWIGCDINIGAIQTTTKRLAQIIDSQLKTNGKKLIKDDFKGLLAFKILNVNEYDIFKNEIEAKDIVMEMYGVEPIKRGAFDGTLDNNFVKVMPLNRVLNKLDIKTVLKDIDDNTDSFTVKATQKQGEEIYEEGVTIICSGAELDVEDYLKKENKSGVKVVIRDILNDKKNLIFKQKPEAKIEIEVKDKKLTVSVEEFYSPILMRKLELENEKIIDKKDKAKVEDFKQIIDSVTIDIDYDGKLFNAEIMDLPEKKEVISASYHYTYEKAGTYRVAIKIVDVLGEEYFETFSVKA